MVPDLADGLWPAWWTMGIRPGFWPDRGELDILEMGSADAIQDGVINRRVISAAHWDSPSNRYCCGNGVVEGPEGDGRCDGSP